MRVKVTLEIEVSGHVWAEKNDMWANGSPVSFEEIGQNVKLYCLGQAQADPMTAITEADITLA